MSATRNIMTSCLFSMPYIGYQPANVSNGEPAVTAANLTKQTILGAPFKWAWNRAQQTLQLDPFATSWPQDNTVTLPDYGFVEQAWLTDQDTGKVAEIKIKNSLAAESSMQRPASVSVQTDDGDGNLLIRLNTIPDKAYAIDFYYQMAPRYVSSLASLWKPIPDHLSYIYDWIFLGFMGMLTRDARAGQFLAKGVAHLLGAQDGLTALQRNIFLGNWLDVMNQQGREQLATQQGAQARGAS
jgi:hypothetical protein